MHPRRHQSRDVRHVHKKQRVNRLSHFPDALEIDYPRIRARSRNNHPRLVLMRQLLDFLVIDPLVFLPHPISHKFVHPTGKVQWMPMRQCPPCAKFMPSTVSPGFSVAMYTATFADVPECACTLACSAPNSSFARSIASCSTLSAYSHPP